MNKIDRLVKVCGENEIADGEIKSFKFGDTTVLIAKYKNEVYALDDVCSHDGAELSDGDLVDCQIQCQRHGARFDLKTGEATQMPAIVGIKSFKVKIESGDIFIELKD
jgi:3-phenylpropionate/trans-cinnamate dioxygenase ferredoxin subunit